MSRLFTWALALLVAIGSVPAALAAGDDATERASAESLTQMGVTLESARLLSGADRVAALNELDRALASWKSRDSDERAASQFLAGEIYRELGDWKEANEAYRRASGSRGPFADDAAFAAIQVLEAEGKDEEAAREWVKWKERYAESTLQGEADLARAWNTLRRGEIAEAERVLKELLAAHSWMAGDERVVLARAAVHHAAGRPAEALAVLGTGNRSAAETYLRALAYGAQGSALKAAALFQETAERFPESSLRDHALLAKANIFFQSRDYKSAAQEFARVAEIVRDPAVRAEAELRGAGAVFLAGDTETARGLLRGVIERHSGSDVAARAQFLIGEVARSEGQHAQAIIEFNQVLAQYYDHAVAASAQYRVARALDGLDRRAEATSAYQAVVSGYPLAPEAPAAAYLAGVGLLAQERPLVAAPYFQLVLDKYAAGNDSSGTVVFASPEHQELVEAALCLVEYSYHRAGNLGLLSGAPHTLLQRMPASRSPWRANALLIDADASAAQGRYAEAEATLERLFREFPDHPVGASANKLLAWTYARRGRDSLAIATEERMIERYATSGDVTNLGSAYLNIAHSRFNQKRYAEAAAAYTEFLQRFPTDTARLVARYQAGLCYMRLDRAGDAVDQWEAILADSVAAPIAERAWARAGDLYFQAERYPDAKRCYEGLLQHFAQSSAAAIATLRLAQCEYNAGRDAEALTAFSQTIERFPGTPAAREAARGTEMALYRLGQSAGGAEVLAQLIEKYPTSAFAADAQFQIARKAYEAKSYAEAAEAFRRVVAQFPGYSAADHAQFLLADCYAQLGSEDEARIAYEQFLSYFPDSELRPAVKFRLGLMHFAASNHLQAAIMFTAVLDDSLAAEMAAASLYNLALCQRQLGQTAEAEAALNRYRRTYPGDERKVQVAYQLGDLYDASGKLREAAAEFEAALAAGPDPELIAELRYRLGQCREKSGDTSGAVRAYEQAMAATPKEDAYRLSALARLAAIYEEQGDAAKAVTCYRDIGKHSPDSELAAAAQGRADELAAATGGKKAASRDRQPTD